jgi:hypothetical protein
MIPALIAGTSAGNLPRFQSYFYLQIVKAAFGAFTWELRFEFPSPLSLAEAVDMQGEVQALGALP